MSIFTKPGKLVSAKISSYTVHLSSRNVENIKVLNNYTVTFDLILKLEINPAI